MEEFLGPLHLFQLLFVSQLGFCVSFPLKKKVLQEWKLLFSAMWIPFVLRFTQDLGKQDALHLLPVSKWKCSPGGLCCVPCAHPASVCPGLPRVLTQRAPRLPCALVQVARSCRSCTSQCTGRQSQSQPTFLRVTFLPAQWRVWRNRPPWALYSLPLSAPHHPQAGPVSSDSLLSSSSSLPAFILKKSHWIHLIRLGRNDCWGLRLPRAFVSHKKWSLNPN